MTPNTYTIDAGGYRWTIGLPQTAQLVKFEHQKRKLEMEAVKAECGDTGKWWWIIQYEAWGYRDPKPFPSNVVIALDKHCQGVCSAHSLDTVLTSLATGKSVAELLATHTTAKDFNPERKPVLERWLEPIEDVLADLKRLRDR